MSEKNQPSSYDRLHEKKSLIHAIHTMPKWKKLLLGGSLALGIIGISGQGASKMLKNNAPPAVTPATHTPATFNTATHSPGPNPGSPGAAGPGSSIAPPGSSGFVSGSPVQSTSNLPPSGEAPPVTTPSSQSPSLTDAMTPFMTQVGFSLFVGAVIGFIFRVFIKMALTLTAVVLAIGAALNYFHILNFDSSQLKAQTSSMSGWLMSQGYHVRDLIFSQLPSSTAAMGGFFLGFKRR